MSTSLYSVSRRDRSSPLTDLHQWTMSLWHSMVCHAVLSRRRGDNHSFSLRRKLEIIASRERQHSSTLAFTQQGMNSITQVLFTKCYSSSEAVCFFFVICQVCSFAAELVEQQGCRKSKTLKKILSALAELFCPFAQVLLLRLSVPKAKPTGWAAAADSTTHGCLLLTEMISVFKHFKYMASIPIILSAILKYLFRPF